MSPYQFSRWLEYALLEPDGPLQDDLRFGYLCSLMHNAHFSGARKQPWDFFPSLEQQEAPLTDSEEDANLLLQIQMKAHADSLEIAKRLRAEWDAEMAKAMQGGLPDG